MPGWRRPHATTAQSRTVLRCAAAPQLPARHGRRPSSPATAARSAESGECARRMRKQRRRSSECRRAQCSRHATRKCGRCGRERAGSSSQRRGAAALGAARHHTRRSWQQRSARSRAPCCVAAASRSYACMHAPRFWTQHAAPWLRRYDLPCPHARRLSGSACVKRGCITPPRASSTAGARAAGCDAPGRRRASISPIPPQRSAALHCSPAQRASRRARRRISAAAR